MNLWKHESALIFGTTGAVIISTVLLYTNIFHLPLYILLASEVHQEEANIYFLTFDIILGMIGGIVIYRKLRSRNAEK